MTPKATVTFFGFTSKKDLSVLQYIVDFVSYSFTDPAAEQKRVMAVHIPIVVAIVDKTIKTNPGVYNPEISLLGAWLHDIGLIYPITGVTDHAIAGETRGRELLTLLHLDPIFLEKVCHIIRAHRNADVTPQTLEAKLIAAADSASHFDIKVHIDIYTNGQIRNEIPTDKQTQQQKAQFALGKLKRDWRDMEGFPDLQEVYGKEYLRLKQLFTENL